MVNLNKRMNETVKRFKNEYNNVPTKKNKTYTFHPRSVFSVPISIKQNKRPRSLSETERKRIHSEEIGSIRLKVNATRKIKQSLNNFSKYIFKTFYSSIKDIEDIEIIHKHGNRRFKRIFSKNIFRLLSEGKNIFTDYTLTKKNLIQDYDIIWVERNFNVPTNNVVNNLPLTDKIVKISQIKPYTLNVSKRFIDGFYIFSEWNDTLKITEKQYNILKSRYNHKWSLFNVYIFLMVLRYTTIGNTNSHCSVPPNIIKNFGLCELFGSPLNTNSDIYYSPFEDIECFFGSKGNFFTSEILPGNYLANPPFDPIIVHKTILKIISIMKTVKNVNILVNIPKYDYTETESLDKLKNDIISSYSSKYCIYRTSLPKEEYNHYNYYLDKYIPVCDTELILFSNTKNTLDVDVIKELWRSNLVINKTYKKVEPPKNEIGISSKIS